MPEHPISRQRPTAPANAAADCTLRALVRLLGRQAARELYGEAQVEERVCSVDNAVDLSRNDARNGSES